MLKLNETLVNPELGSTLEKIAEDPMSFYHGSIAEQIVEDIQQAGGIITRSDMRNYDAGRSVALKVTLNKHNLWTSRPPSSGPVLAMILQILKGILKFKTVRDLTPPYLHELFDFYSTG